MRAHLRRLSVAVAVIICGSLTASAQWRDVVTKGVPLTPAGTPNLEAPAPRMSDGKTPDLSGIWDAEKRPCNEAQARLGCIDAVQGIPVGAINIAAGIKEGLPLQPWAAALLKQRRDTAGKDHPAGRCLPGPGPAYWPNFVLQKVIQTSQSLTILGEYMIQFRQIFLDGRALPTNPEPMFMGYSVGTWEGDTLVVETIGFKDDNWLDLLGHPLTSQARTTERIRRVNFGNLEVALTVDDPKAYTKPWTVTFKLGLALNTELLEYICNENEKSLQHMVDITSAK